MAILKFVQYPDPILEKISEKVDIIDTNIQKLMDDMAETMYNAKNIIGLAAVQMGYLKRICVVDIEHEQTPPQPYFFVNPEIIEISEEKVIGKEASPCFPGSSALVNRARWIKIKYLNYYGEEKILEAEDLFARAIQHELDHLDGRVYIDHISPLKRSLIQAKAKKLRK